MAESKINYHGMKSPVRVYFDSGYTDRWTCPADGILNVYGTTGSSEGRFRAYVSVNGEVMHSLAGYAGVGNVATFSFPVKKGETYVFQSLLNYSITKLWHYEFK